MLANRWLAAIFVIAAFIQADVSRADVQLAKADDLTKRMGAFLPRPLAGWTGWGGYAHEKTSNGERHVRTIYQKGAMKLFIVIYTPRPLPYRDPYKAIHQDPNIRSQDSRIINIQRHPVILGKRKGQRVGYVLLSGRYLVVAIADEIPGAKGLRQWDSVIQYLRAIDLDGLAALR